MRANEPTSANGAVRVLVRVAFERYWPGVAALYVRGNPDAHHKMKILKRSNRIYDTTRFDQPEIRIRHHLSTGKIRNHPFNSALSITRHKNPYAELGIRVTFSIRLRVLLHLPRLTWPVENNE